MSHDEIAKVRKCVEESKDIQEHAFGRRDSNDRLSRMCMWSYAGDDVLGCVSRFKINFEFC